MIGQVSSRVCVCSKGQVLLSVHFLLSRLLAYRGAHARKFRVCVEKGWRPPPPFPLTLTALTAQRGHLGHSGHKHSVRGLLGHFDPAAGGWEKKKNLLSDPKLQHQ